MIFDPFLGTGTSAVVAKKLGRKYYGIEKDKNYFKAAYGRINNTKIIKEEIASVIKEEEEFRSLLMELPDTMIDPTVDIAAGSFSSGQFRGSDVCKNWRRKIQKTGRASNSNVKRHC